MGHLRHLIHLGHLGHLIHLGHLGHGPHRDSVSRGVHRSGAYLPWIGRFALAARGEQSFPINVFGAELGALQAFDASQHFGDRKAEAVGSADRIAAAWRVLRLANQLQDLLPAGRGALRRDGRLEGVLGGNAEERALQVKQRARENVGAAIENLGRVENAPQGLFERNEEPHRPTRHRSAQSSLKAHRPDELRVVVRRKLRHDPPPAHHRRARHRQRQLHAPQKLPAGREERLGVT